VHHDSVEVVRRLVHHGVTVNCIQRDLGLSNAGTKVCACRRKKGEGEGRGRRGEGEGGRERGEGEGGREKGEDGRERERGEREKIQRREEDNKYCGN
jgi:hypothetical protein